MKCACGKELHYRSRGIRRMMEKIVELCGEYVEMKFPSGTYKIQRHYMSIHGIKPDELPELARQGIIVKISD